mgnify:CR=1 FL=1
MHYYSLSTASLKTRYRIKTNLMNGNNIMSHTTIFIMYSDPTIMLSPLHLLLVLICAELLAIYMIYAEIHVTLENPR